RVAREPRLQQWWLVRRPELWAHVLLAAVRRSACPERAGVGACAAAHRGPAAAAGARAGCRRSRARPRGAAAREDDFRRSTRDVQRSAGGVPPRVVAFLARPEHATRGVGRPAGAAHRTERRSPRYV